MEIVRSSNEGVFIEPWSFLASVAVVLWVRHQMRRVPSPKTPPRTALTRGQRCGFPLISKRHLSHDTVLMRFGLPTPQHVLGLPAGQHLFCYATIEGETVMRAYSTVTPPKTPGYFDIALKVYFPDPPKYPGGGRMSQHLNGLSPGDVVEFKGPVGRFVYEGKGVFSKNRRSSKTTKISMIAAGTGIAPFLQIIRKILDDPSDPTQISLIYANKTEKDILFHHELNRLSSRHRNLSVHYTVEKPSRHWVHSRGRIDREMLQRYLFKADDGSIVLLCGPGPMTDAMSRICTSQLGWSTDQIAVF